MAGPFYGEAENARSTEGETMEMRICEPDLA